MKAIADEIMPYCITPPLKEEIKQKSTLCVSSTESVTTSSTYLAPELKELPVTTAVRFLKSFLLSTSIET